MVSELSPELPQEGFKKTESGIYIPIPQEQPNRETRRRIAKQVKQYNRQQARKNR